MKLENTKTEETASANPGLAVDVGRVTATIIVKFVSAPAPVDAEVADAWCRITAALGVRFDPRPHLDGALGLLHDDGTGETHSKFTSDDGGQS